MKLLTISALVLALSTVIKGVALIKEMVVASTFGLSLELDAFIYTFTLISFVINITAGAFGAAYLPRFSHFKASGEGSKYASEMLWGVLIAGFVATLAVSIVALGFCFLKAEYGSVALLLSPLLLIGLLNTWATQTHIASNRILLATTTPFVTPIVIMSSVWYGGKDINVLALSTLCGGAIETFILWSILAIKDKIRLHKHLGDEYRLLLGHISPLAMSSILTGGALIIEQTFATTLGAGGVSSYAYGQKIPFFIIALGIGVIAGVIFPYFSTLSKNTSLLKQTTHKIAGLIILAGSLVALLFLMFSVDIVRLLYARGAFDETAVARVSLVQSMFALQIGLHLGCAVYVKALSALSHNKEILKISMVMLLTNVFLDIFFMQFLNVAGLALASSITQAIALIISFRVLRKLI